MSLFPDVRNDSDYNEKFLNESDDAFIQGFDLALENVINLFADNLDVYEDELTELCPEGHTIEPDEAFAKREDLYEIIKDNKEIICAVIKDWMENERNSTVTSLLDNMDDEEYEMIKESVLQERPDLKRELYDTRKFIVTGKKITLEDKEG